MGLASVIVAEILLVGNLLAVPLAVPLTPLFLFRLCMLYQPALIFMLLLAHFHWTLVWFPSTRSVAA
jgi:hypothetical protein